MKRGLRFSSVETMPASLQRAVTKLPEQPRPNKYGARATVVDGIRFASKAEGKFYSLLEFQKRQGDVKFYLRQVPLHLPGGTRLVLDFVIFHTDGRIRWVDVKGRETDAFKIKRREIQHHYPITIELVKP